METHEKIEVIMLTVAEFYGIDWRLMMSKTKRNYGYMRAHVYRLTVEHLPTTRPDEYLGVTKQAYVACLRDHKQDHIYNILSFKVKSLTTSQKIAS